MSEPVTHDSVIRLHSLKIGQIVNWSRHIKGRSCVEQSASTLLAAPPMYTSGCFSNSRSHYPAFNATLLRALSTRKSAPIATEQLADSGSRHSVFVLLEGAAMASFLLFRCHVALGGCHGK
jgi:hypothetical protein